MLFTFSTPIKYFFKVFFIALSNLLTFYRSNIWHIRAYALIA